MRLDLDISNDVVSMVRCIAGLPEARLRPEVQSTSSERGVQGHLPKDPRRCEGEVLLQVG